MSQEQLAVVDLLADGPAATTAGGVLTDVFADYPTGSPDWTNVSATFAEYRVLALRVQFIPNATGAVFGTLLYSPVYVVWDASSSLTALTSYANAVNYAVFSAKSLNEPWIVSHKMDGIEESAFVATSSPIVDYSFKVYADTLTASTSYGRFVTHFKCQFRGRL
jgi:hypothetical protein